MRIQFHFNFIPLYYLIVRRTINIVLAQGSKCLVGNSWHRDCRRFENQCQRNNNNTLRKVPGDIISIGVHHSAPQSHSPPLLPTSHMHLPYATIDVRFPAPTAAAAFKLSRVCLLGSRQPSAPICGSRYLSTRRQQFFVPVILAYGAAGRLCLSNPAKSAVERRLSVCLSIPLDCVRRVRCSCSAHTLPCRKPQMPSPLQPSTLAGHSSALCHREALLGHL